MEANLAEKVNLKLVTLPVDLNTAAVTGGRVSIKGCSRIAFVVSLGDSTAASTVFTLRQHNAASGGTSADLSVANVYYTKKGAETSFTKVEPTVAAAAYDLSARFSDDEGVAVFEVLEDQLNTESGYAWVSLDIADSGAAKLGSVLAVCHALHSKPGYSQAL
jgi:hypothetical protein